MRAAAPLRPWARFNPHHAAGAVAGGTLRDLMIGATAIRHSSSGDPMYMYIVLEIVVIGTLRRASRPTASSTLLDAC